MRSAKQGNYLKTRNIYQQKIYKSMNRECELS